MDSFQLADWTSLRGASGSITQSADRWLDLSMYEDLVFYLDVKEVTGTVTMNYETAPTKQDLQFVAMVAPFAMSVGTRNDVALFSTAGVPIARYARWRISGTGIAGGSYDAQFRIMVAAYSFG